MSVRRRRVCGHLNLTTYEFQSSTTKTQGGLPDIDDSGGLSGPLKLILRNCNAVYEAAMKMDERLLKLLYANAATKNAFFKKVGEIAVFDKQGFGWTVSNEEILKGSYTRFRNKIGLATREGDFTSVRLVPVNDDFDEIKLTNKGKDVRKYKVVGVRRSKVKVVS